MKKTLLISDASTGGDDKTAATKSETSNLLREQLIKIFNLPANSSEQDIAAAAAAAQEFNVTIKAELAQEAAEEEVIAKKMHAGLTREQAVSVINNQKKHDEAIIKLWEKRRPKIVKILNEGAKENLKEREIRGLIREFDAAITTDEINAAKQSLENNAAKQGA